MMSQLQQYTADHRYLLEFIKREADFRDPVGVDLDEFHLPLLKHSRKGAILPIDGVLVRTWFPNNRRFHPGIQLGVRLYEIEGIRFALIRLPYNQTQNCQGLDFAAVERANYQKLYKIALRHRRDMEPPSLPPVLPQEQLDSLWKNTIDYLDRFNLERIKEYGGRPRRGVLLTGSPGNGKTMACRWIWEECRRRHWEWRLVTPDAYRQSRAYDQVEQLFTVERRGVIFFDDMDLALRDRESVQETEDQAVFLTALDGITVNEGVVFVFTTNCSLDLIDRAFKRPGRIDVVLNFKAPDPKLRRQLIDRWHKDICANLNLDTVTASTDGYSFAEMEELKNLLIMHFMDSNKWDWEWALRQFAINREELMNGPRRRVGFAAKSDFAESASDNGW
jgi:hypothetical protein